MSQEIPKATHDGKLNIGDLEIPCAVLEDGTRLLTETGVLKSLGRASRPRGNKPQDKHGDRTPAFLRGKSLKPYISQELLDETKPFIFITKQGNRAYGFKAGLLPKICEVFLAARDAGDLNRQQEHIAKQCEILVRGLAHVGIIALVDEATGYQYFRARRALEEILDQFIAKELRKWSKTFPDEFYEQLFKLRGWRYIPFSVKRPKYVGKLTNDLIYERLAPGVLEELKRLNPPNEKGGRKSKHFQWLTEDVGHPRLREHIASVIALMKASTKWDQFYRMLQRALPRQNTNLELPLPGEEE